MCVINLIMLPRYIKIKYFIFPLCDGSDCRTSQYEPVQNSVWAIVALSFLLASFNFTKHKTANKGS